MKSLLPGSRSLADKRGSVFWSDKLQTNVLPTYHPAAVLRSPELYPDLARDILKAAQYAQGTTQVDAGAPDIAWDLITSQDALDALLGRFRFGGNAALDTEFASTQAQQKLLCLGISPEPGYAGVLTEQLLSDRLTINKLNYFLRGVCQVGQSYTADLKPMWKVGIKSATTGRDTLLEAYTLDERHGTHGLKYLAQRWLGVNNYADPVSPYKSHMEDCPPELMYPYNARDAAYTLMLEQELDRQLDDKARSVLNEILYPACDTLARMEVTGITIDRPYLEQLKDKMDWAVEAIQGEMNDVVGHEFNPNSFLQIQSILYEELGLPIPGRPMTDKKSLELISLVRPHPFLDLLIGYRQNYKLLSAYVNAMLKAADSDDRVHTTFKMAEAVTGRLSSANPALQNISRNKAIRRSFIATPGWTMVRADYSQIEVRMLCWLSRDEKLRETLTSGEDLHNRTAQILFGEVNPVLRQKAKTFTFALLYQMTTKGLADALKVPLAEATRLQALFFEAYPQVKDWIEQTKGFVLENGYVETPFGRRRRFGLITNENRNEILRQAVNAPSQGGATDVMLKALARFDKRIQKGEIGNTRLLLTVHDEIITETREDPQEVGRILKSELEQTVLDGWVPFDVEVKIGQHW
jgi:DNA polymerase-1